MKKEIKKYLAEGKRYGKKLNHFKMLKDICDLVETDFCGEMEMKLLPKSKPYSRKESEHMANLLGEIYSIAHCITCRACQNKFL